MRFLTKAIVHTQPESDETGEIIEKLNIVNPVENVLNTSDLEPELGRKPDHNDIDDINEIEDLNCYDDDDNIDHNEYIDDDNDQVSMLLPPTPARTGDLRYVFYRRHHNNDDKYKYFKLLLQFVITMILIIFFFWLFNMAKLNKSKNRSNITYNNNTFDNNSNHN